jgi:hypothetical protein
MLLKFTIYCTIICSVSCWKECSWTVQQQQQSLYSQTSSVS